MAQNPEPTYALSIRGSTVVVGKDEYQIAAELIHIVNYDCPNGTFKKLCAVLGISPDAQDHAFHSLHNGCDGFGPGIGGACRRCATREVEHRLEHGEALE